jgi:hypothetical protein
MKPDVQSLIEQARDLDNPTAEERDRVRRSLGAAIASAGVVTTMGTAAKAAAGSATATTGSVKVSALGAWVTSKALLWTSVGIISGAVGWEAVQLVDAPKPAAAPMSGQGSRTADGKGPLSETTGIEPGSRRGAQDTPPPTSHQRVEPSDEDAGPGRTPTDVTLKKSDELAHPAAPSGQFRAPKSPESRPAESRAGSAAKAAIPNTSSVSPIEPGENDAAPPGRTLEGELELIRDAQTALRQSDPSRALRLVRSHEQRFPKGVLTEERLAAQALAQCQLGQMGAARGTIERFRQASTHSPLWDRVAEECGIGK